MNGTSEMPLSNWLQYDWVVITLVLLAASVAMLRVLRNAAVARGVLIALQLPCALLLLVALLLRDAPLTGSMIVLTEGASRADLVTSSEPDDESSSDESLPPVIALGSVDFEHAGLARAPDLATALRRYPGISHVHVLGHGLQAHDREALGDRELSFAPPATPDTADTAAALVEWELPSVVNAGAVWRLRGRVRGDVTAIELRDPADGLEASTTPAADGRFELLGTARAAGPVLFVLRLRDGETTLQSLPVPINAVVANPMRALLLAAVPSPELKYLRRWASDAGVVLDSRISLAPGLTQARNLAAIDAAMLAELDLLIVDERSWPNLTRQVPALREAIGKGLGVLIRITGPVPAAVQADWRALGLAVELATNTPRAVHLDDGAAVVAGERLHAWPLKLNGSDHVEVLRDTKERPVAVRRPLGQGRLGLLALTDSFRLATRGEPARHATLWSNLFADLARGRAEPALDLPELAVVGQRAVVCGGGDGLRLQMPGAQPVLLLNDPAAGNCAAFWPTSAGWHSVLAGATVPPVEATNNPLATSRTAATFYVFDPPQIDSMLEQNTLVATAALVNRQSPPTAIANPTEHWRRAALLLWLIVMAASWWLERRIRQTPPTASDASARIQHGRHAG